MLPTTNAKQKLNKIRSQFVIQNATFQSWEHPILQPLFDSALMSRYMYALVVILYTSSARQETALRLSGQSEAPLRGVVLGGVALGSAHVEQEGQLWEDIWKR